MISKTWIYRMPFITLESVFTWQHAFSNTAVGSVFTEAA